MPESIDTYIEIYCRSTRHSYEEQEGMKLALPHIRDGYTTTLDDVFPRPSLNQYAFRLATTLNPLQRSERKNAYTKLNQNPDFRDHIKSLIEEAHPYITDTSNLVQIIRTPLYTPPPGSGYTG